MNLDLIESIPNFDSRWISQRASRLAVINFMMNHDKAGLCREKILLIFHKELQVCYSIRSSQLKSNGNLQILKNLKLKSSSLRRSDFPPSF